MKQLAAVGLNLLLLGGLGAAIYGIWQIYEPLAWIAGGISLCGLSWLIWKETR